MASIEILGAETWGTALARLLSNNGHCVTVWSTSEKKIDYCLRNRRHPNLGEMIIPKGVGFTKLIGEACNGKDIIIFAVPSVSVRQTAKQAVPHIKNNQILVDVSKGLEVGSLMTMTEVIKSEVISDGMHSGVRVVALSGPTHAEEVARDLPTTIVSACSNQYAAKVVQDVVTNSYMRVYTNYDVLGVELCGALKNIIAIAAGISQGLGYGDNAKAALITRGLYEITQLGVAMGCSEETFFGLAGLGDLVVTATSENSRNNKCGQLIGRGMSADEAIKQIDMVVEGVNAIPAALQLSQKYGIEMPIIYAVNDVIFRGADPAETVSKLYESRAKV